MPTGLEEAAAISIIASSIMSLFGGGDEQEMPIQYPQLNFQPQQAPQMAPFQPMGQPQQPTYGGQPSITRFPPFQPLFGKRREGQ